MIFNSIEYAVFLPTVWGAYWWAGARGRLWLLLTASYLFYGWWDWRFLGLIALTTAIDYAIGRGLARREDEAGRRVLLAVSIVSNLAILGTFKYFDFFADSLADVLRSVGFEASVPTLSVLLPVGISFYTFQTMSYTIDVFRRRLTPTADPLLFAVYVAFFPQLVAGPIERATHLLPQLADLPRRPRPDQVTTGLALIVQGLFKKVVIADGLAPFVNRAFAEPGSASWLTLLFASYGFALQIYGDFSGYTDIARGSARLFGVELMENFRQPYLSRSITEFWRTWHISLSTWLRDYLYVPLGGNRGGRSTTARNLMLTMLIGGLWHGAAWTFVVWGGLHGTYLAVERARARHGRPSRSRDELWRAVTTFHLVCVAWVFFRAASLGQATEILGRIASLGGGAVDTDGVALVLVAGLIVLVIDLLERAGGDVPVLVRLSVAPRGVALGVAIVGLVVFSGGTPVPFIYFRF